VRGAAAGDRVFCMIGTGSGVIGIIATHGAPNALAGAITGVGFIGGGLVFRQATGRHQMVVGLNTAAAIFACAAIGAAAGQGRLLVAGFATLLTAFVLEIRHIHLLNMLDGRRWTGKIPDDDIAPDESTPRRPPIPNPVAGRRRRLRRLRLAALAARGACGSRRLRLAALAARGACGSRRWRLAALAACRACGACGLQRLQLAALGSAGGGIRTSGLGRCGRRAA
jgi:putative Mg2+ transporter-C (MgtC) family protein